ncbi:MAG: glycosyltransferase family 4 protein [Cypionkella sp.]|nr:glycosyltransferase family 4 protein [Cypionkella sp.]
MSKANSNAAIWYAQDGFDPAAKGINGRRVAGESFLKGFLRHADVDEFVILSKNAGEVDPVRELARALRPDVPLRHAPLIRPHRIGVGSVFYPSPNFTAEGWRRAPHGTGAWSLCGITHTTSTAAVMQGWMELRTGPIQPWDAVICTSRAVLHSTTFTFDLIDDHLRTRFGANLPPRPMLPVIPLGIHCDDFARDEAARADLRARINAGADDVVFATIARLTPHEKFDPLPIYLAMQAAQAQLAGQKLHVVFCGQFRDDYSRRVFEQGAARLMPDVGFHLLDGASAADRRATLSGADVFTFLIDNIQETFGLAPLEGMAAGLPLLVSDWDGMKDTVSEDIGFRIATKMLPAPSLAPEALRYQGGIDSYIQYCGSTSAMTEIDLPELTARVVQLARDPDLRARMGAAAQARVRALYDWRVVVPQMQELWAEQTRLRAASAAQHRRYGAHLVPVAPSPSALFAGYPTAIEDMPRLRLIAGHNPHSVGDVLAVRNYKALGRILAEQAQIELALGIIVAAGQEGASLQDLIDASAGSTAAVTPFDAPRIAMWLLKYGFAVRATG